MRATIITTGPNGQQRKTTYENIQKVSNNTKQGLIYITFESGSVGCFHPQFSNICIEPN